MFAFLTLSRIVSTNEAKDSWVCNSMFRFLKSEPPLRGMSFCQTSPSNERVLPTPSDPLTSLLVSNEPANF